MARATVLKRFEFDPELALHIETRAKAMEISQTAFVEGLIRNDADELEAALWPGGEIVVDPLAQSNGGAVERTDIRIGKAIDLIMSDDGFEVGMEVLAELAGRDMSAVKLTRQARPVAIQEIAQRPASEFKADIQTDSKPVSKPKRVKGEKGKGEPEPALTKALDTILPSHTFHSGTRPIAGCGECAALKAGESKRICL
jgi:hypothetical protein